MKLDTSIPRLTSVSLYMLLKRHALLPVSLGEEGLQRAIHATANAATFMAVTEGEGQGKGVVASILTYPLEPGVLGIMWIPETKGLNKDKRGLWALSESLREIWFQGDIRRVEARVAKSRIQTIKALKVMGFRQETTDHGIRQAVDYGKGWESMLILGMLDTDTVRKHEPCLNMETEGVA